MYQRTFLTGLAVTILVVQACGSDDGKRRIAATDAGMGGEAHGGDAPNSGGSSEPMNVGGEPNAGTGGAAGEGPMPLGGSGGGAAGEGHTPSAGSGGEAGAPRVPELEILFTVKPGAVGGLGDTAISDQSEPQNVIYSSRTADQSWLVGDSEVKVVGETLGLAATDQIVSFTLLQAAPQNPTYLFSMADGSRGGAATRVSRSYLYEGGGEGNIYFSDGVPSFRNLGEGGDQYGYNGMLARAVTLGLADGTERSEGTSDDLTGLVVRDARDAGVPLTEIYFTVSPDAVGVADSAVEAVAAEERACTVFHSTLDGNNTVAFSCAELGLVTGDELDALLIYGAAAPSKVVFSVKYGAEGALGTAVEASALALAATGATLFQSPGDGSNSVLKAPSDLGLSELDDDELDAVTVVDAPPPSVTHAATCNPAYDPFDLAEGALLSVGGVSHVGPAVMVVFGYTGTTVRHIAYDAATCAFLQQKDMPGGFDSSTAHAIAPLPGWSAAAPLDTVEHFRVESSGQSSQLYAKRYDAAGIYLDEVPIITESNVASIAALVHEPVSNQLYVLIDSNSSFTRHYQLGIMPRPDGVLTSLNPRLVNLTLPCSAQAGVTGTDVLGNLYVAQRQSSGTDYRVCAYTPGGELLPAPYFWTPEGPLEQRGFIVGGAAHFLFSTTAGAGPAAIEHGVYQAP